MKQHTDLSKIKISETIKSRLCILFFLIISFNLSAQTYGDLKHLQGHRVKTHYSIGASAQAKIMAERCDKVLAFYNQHINFAPDVTLLILSPLDWGKYTNFPVYGMPHYDKSILIVASENNDFWKSFIPPVDQLPKEFAEQIAKTYVDQEGDLTMQPFFDLLAIHELGHAYHTQGGLIMQRKWMGELFANVLLHTYIASNEPELLPALTLFPKMVVSTTNKASLKFTTLREIEEHYDEIGQKYPSNYGWYQCRWHMAAAVIFDAGGIHAYKKLWLTLKEQREILNNAAFATLLADQVHQSVANVQLKWDE